MYVDLATLRTDLATQNDTYWREVGEARALTIFRRAAREVPAYQDVLAKHKIQADDIVSYADFEKLPILTKKNYITQYSLEERCYGGCVGKGDVIFASSGTTAAPTYWLRNIKNTNTTELLHELICNVSFHAQEKNTLFINCFHLGSHIAGMVTASAMEEVLKNIRQGSLINPGLKKEDILAAIATLSNRYDQTVLIGYPPFIKDIVDIAIERGYDFGSNPPSFLFAAESFPESWRQYLHKQVDPSSDAVTSINIYGSADIGFMAHETAYTIALRSSEEFVSSDKVVSQNFVPPLYQYHPWHLQMECVQGELIVTSESTIPLIRYNMKDRGAIYTVSELPQIKGINQWNLPVVALYGRSDVLTTFYGVNMYPDHIRHILAHESIIKDVSGKFVLETTYDTHKNQQFEIHVEMNPGDRNAALLTETIQQVILNHLGEVNHEYAKLLSVIEQQAHPNVHVHQHGAEAFQSAKMKQKYVS